MDHSLYYNIIKLIKKLPNYINENFRNIIHVLIYILNC